MVANRCGAAGPTPTLPLRDVTRPTGTDDGAPVPVPVPVEDDDTPVAYDVVVRERDFRGGGEGGVATGSETPTAVPAWTAVGMW